MEAAGRANGARAVMLGMALALAADAWAQQLYKWTDEKGNVHYTDKAPERAGGTVLDKQGRQVRKIEAPPTPEQARALEADEARKKASAKDAELANRRDRALMSSYTTESEIDLAKARASATFETQIQGAQAYLAQLTRRKQDIDARKARFGDKPIPPQLQHESESADAEYAKNADLVVQKRRELAAVVAKYDADKVRWRELKAQEGPVPATASANRPPPPVTAPK